MYKRPSFLTILFLVGIIGLTSCEEQPFLTIDEIPITAVAAGTYTVAVSSNGEWTALVEDAVNNEWCMLTNASGTNDGTVTVHVAENTTPVPRNATVSITLGNLTKSVVINQDALSLVGTTWKLAGIVDVETEEIRELEPKNCENCYWFWFYTDSTASGRSVSNLLLVSLKPVVQVLIGTSVLGPDYYLEDAILFRNIIQLITSYEINMNELKFYYNDNKNYLLFKLRES